MRILFVSDYGAPGGAELLLDHLRSGLQDRGFEARSLGAGPGCDYRCWSTDGPINPLVRMVNPSACLTMRRAIDEFRPQVIHVSMFLFRLSPAILPIMEGIPVVYYVNLLGPICPKGSRWIEGRGDCSVAPGWSCLRQCLSPQAWLALMAQRSLFLHYRRVISKTVATSHYVERSLQSYGLAPDEVIYPGTVVSSRRPAREASRVIACAARLAPEKGIDVLLRALATIPRATLWLAGSGPEEERLRALAHRLGLDGRVEWLGLLEPDQLRERFSRAWVQVVPSRWQEPFGLVACEAAALGLPVVASRVGGLVEIVHDGYTGLCVEPEDEVGLSRALARLLDHPDLAREMGARAHARCLERFSRTRCVDRFESLYRSLAS